MFISPEEKSINTPTPIFDPFPEPVTMPSGWDLSEFNSEPEQTSSPPAASPTGEYAGTAFYTNFLP